MGDFFALILEKLFGDVINLTERISNATLRACIQILVMCLLSGVFIGIVYLVSFAFSLIDKHWGIANNETTRVLLRIVAIIISVLIFAGVLYVISTAIKHFCKG